MAVPESAPSLTHGADAAALPLRVLCAEDDPDIRLILRHCLSPQSGCALLLCASGEELLAQFQNFQPDVLLLDVSMPGLSGPQTLQVLKSMPAMAHVTSILMTAQALPKQLEDLTQLGATGVIVKPFDPLMLAQNLRMYRDLSRGARLSSAQPGSLAV
jgi:two-component system, OmpR family, response regulator